MAKKCKHQNIIITYKSRYKIPMGWNKLMEGKDIELSKYFIREIEEGIFCEDCGKDLDE